MVFKLLQFENALSPIFSIPAGNVMDSKFTQPIKASPPIFFNPTGRVMDVKFIQLENAYFPISVNPAGSVIDVKLAHPTNARSPTTVTPFGNATDFRASFSANAHSPISVTPSGTTTTLSYPVYFFNTPESIRTPCLSSSFFASDSLSSKYFFRRATYFSYSSSKSSARAFPATRCAIRIALSISHPSYFV